MQKFSGDSSRSRKTWMQCVEDDMKLVKLCGNDAQDRVDWRIGIRGNRLTRASTEKQTLKRYWWMIMTLLLSDGHQNKFWPITRIYVKFVSV